MTYKVDLAEPAERDLEDSIRYITLDLSAPISALNMMNIFEEAMAGLSELPQRYAPVADPRLAQLGYRKLLVKSYLIIFSVDERDSVVNIERILYGRRNWLHIL